MRSCKRGVGDFRMQSHPPHRTQTLLLFILAVSIFSTAHAVYFSAEERLNRPPLTRGKNSGKFGPFIAHLSPHNHDPKRFEPAVHRDRAPFERLAKQKHESYAHDSELRTEAEAIGFRVLHTFTHVMDAVVVQGITKKDLQSLEGVYRVSEDGYKYATSISWGIDRIDQPDRPISSSYTPYFHGQGVDIYIVDTGMDTVHNEFANSTYGRTVANVFNAYGSVADNTDGHGHGTHVGGIAGGNTQGVSIAASLYGVKVLSDTGSGSDSNVVAGIEYVVANRNTSRRSVINLSLGGSCDGGDCATDPVVIAVNNAVAAGVVTVVAAGNSYCNAANDAAGSPASAAEAITVAASTKTDSLADYSSFGQYIDIVAPGHSIVSACSSLVCAGSESSFIGFSGTSMAAPHVAGVVAQLLEKNASASVEEVLSALLCDAVPLKLDMIESDTITRNLLLQIPQNDGVFGNCGEGAGCESDCSERGYCFAAHTSSDYGSTEDICYCEGGYGGSSCSSAATVVRSDLCNNGISLTITMNAATPSDPYGWQFASYSIYDNLNTSHLVVDNAVDSFCYTPSLSVDSATHCLPVGCYTLDISTSNSGSEWDALNTWSMCGMSGGGNEKHDFCIAESLGSYYCTAADPTTLPSTAPTATSGPSTAPTLGPTTSPTQSPSAVLSLAPTLIPSVASHVCPSTMPTTVPTCLPSTAPSLHPSANPSQLPSTSPSVSPTLEPTAVPSTSPQPSLSSAPTRTPKPSLSPQPTCGPTVQPSPVPSPTPTTTPSSMPSTAPTVTPPSSYMPTRDSSESPTVAPIVQEDDFYNDDFYNDDFYSDDEAPQTPLPTIFPSHSPSTSPTRAPTKVPTAMPTVRSPPTGSPIFAGNRIPTVAPSTELELGYTIMFDEAITFGGASVESFSLEGQSAIVSAAASEMGLNTENDESRSGVEYFGDEVVSTNSVPESSSLRGLYVHHTLPSVSSASEKRVFADGTITVRATVSVTAAESDYPSFTDPYELYMDLSARLRASVDSGDFITKLESDSGLNNAFDTINLTVVNVSSFGYTVLNDDGDDSETSDSGGGATSIRDLIEKYIVFIIIAVCLVLVFCCYLVLRAKKSRSKTDDEEEDEEEESNRQRHRGNREQQRDKSRREGGRDREMERNRYRGEPDSRDHSRSRSGESGGRGERGRSRGESRSRDRRDRGPRSRRPANSSDMRPSSAAATATAGGHFDVIIDGSQDSHTTSGCDLNSSINGSGSSHNSFLALSDADSGIALERDANTPYYSSAGHGHSGEHPPPPPPDRNQPRSYEMPRTYR